MKYSSLRPIDEEQAVIDYLDYNFTTNPKKLKKIAARIAPDCSDFIVKGLLNDIQICKDPVKHVTNCIAKIREFAILRRQFIEEGNHGMIILGDKVYPLCLKTSPNWLKKDDYWNPDDEKTIRYNAVSNWLDETGRMHFHGKVALFDEFGFSGIPHVVRIQLVPHTADLVPVPDTNCVIRVKKAS